MSDAVLESQPKKRTIQRAHQITETKFATTENARKAEQQPRDNTVDFGTLVADTMKISLVNRIYVTAWLVARNFLFWLIRK